MDQSTNQNSGGIWYLVGLIVIAGLALWYFYGNQMSWGPASEQSPTAAEALPPISSGNTTADISSDLEQTANAAAALDQDAAASAQDVSSF